MAGRGSKVVESRPSVRFTDICGWCGSVLENQVDVAWQSMRSPEGMFIGANYCPSPRSCKAQGAAEPSRVIVRLKRFLEHLDREQVDAP